MATSAFTLFRPFVERMAEKAHDLGADQLVVALCNAANAPVNTYAQLSDLTTIAYTNLSSRNITTTSSLQTAGVYKLTLTTLVLTASGAVAPWRYAVVYNDTSASDYLIGYYDYGADITLATAGETMTFDFAGAAGLITVG